MTIYRRRAIDHEAVQYDGTNVEPIRDMCKKSAKYNAVLHTSQAGLYIQTNGGTVRANVGDWVILTESEDIEIMHKDLFARLYEQADA